MKKVFLVIALLALVTLGFTQDASTIGGTVYEIIPTEIPAEVVDGRTLVPMRAIFEWLGAEVVYTAEDNQVQALRKGISVNLWIGAKRFSIVYADGTRKAGELDVRPMILHERTMVPLRFVAEAMQCRVDYDPLHRAVKIKDGQRYGQITL